MIGLRELIRTPSFGAALAVMFILNGCASGRVRADGEGRSRRRVHASSVRDRIPAKQSSYRIRGTDETGVLDDGQKAKLRAKTRSWRWPTQWVTVTSAFGTRKGEHHDGIDLRASTGTAIHAVSDGKVIYSGSKISGYGRMIVLRHEGRLSTIYAHNSKIYVKAGQKVRRGQLIALSGNTGRSSGPHLHFEVREGVTAINPQILLPSPAVANEASRRMASLEKAKGRMRSSSSSASRAIAASRASNSRKVASRDNRHLAARVAEGDDGFQPKAPRAKRGM